MRNERQGLQRSKVPPGGLHLRESFRRRETHREDSEVVIGGTLFLLMRLMVVKLNEWVEGTRRICAAAVRFE